MRLAAVPLALLASLLLVGAAQAQEQINSFDVTIEAHTDGDVTVTEIINVTSEGRQIRRGIFRDLPRYYTQNGGLQRYQYDVEQVLRDGEREPYNVSGVDNALRIRIGDEDVFLDRGRHVYEIRYRVRNQVRYFDDHDEVYWNATGTYWDFPILSARATVVLPPGAEILDTSGYTGRFRDEGSDYRYSRQGDAHVFEATRRLGAREGLTVSVSFAKGLIDPPSAADRGVLWWQRYGALMILLGTLGGLGWFYYRAFDRVGRDPAKGPVFPRYAPPDGYSPAAVHQIYKRAISGHDALIATLMSLAVKDRIKIDAPDKKTTTLTRLRENTSDKPLSEEETALLVALFRHADTRTLGKKYDSSFTKAYTKFKTDVGRRFGDDYFKWNLGYAIVAVLLSIIAIVIAARASIGWTHAMTMAVLALAGLNAWFMYLLPAPTRKGQDVRTEIEGLKLYMEKAEKLQLNAVEVGSEAPPPMTVERYETFLPYAIALGVEKPWTEHFERLLPEEARNYHPRWAGVHGGYNSAHALNTALVGAMTSGVTSALPQSSGSSGAGGGGFSGGGGGGGGGGGW
ncbi:MAG: DUF2207 domain-containing protein [Maricaulaceae bacterium]